MTEETEQRTARYHTDAEYLANFIEKYDFRKIHPHHFSNCLLLKFDYGSYTSVDAQGKQVLRSPKIVNRWKQRCDETIVLQEKLLETFEVEKPSGFSMLSDPGRLARIGVYYFWSESCQYLAIPNDFPLIQSYLKKHCPSWMKQWVK